MDGEVRLISDLIGTAFQKRTGTFTPAYAGIKFPFFFHPVLSDLTPFILRSGYMALPDRQAGTEGGMYPDL